MNRLQQAAAASTRRTFLGSASMGLGSMALAGMLDPRAFAATTAGRRPVDGRLLASSGVVNPLHFVPKAKRVIFLCMAGGPSHLELFDEKPELAKLSGKPMPKSFTKGQPIAQLQGKELICWGAQTKFRKHGQSG